MGRSSWQVQRDVIAALFLREAIKRISAGRAAWLWLLLEPVVHASFVLFVFTVIRARVIGGIDSAVWILVGLTSFFMFRRAAVQSANALSANAALFAYRQVKPVDTVIVRAALEIFLMLIVTVIVFVGAALIGHDVLPANPLGALIAWFGLGILGLGYGLMVSIAQEMIPELGRVVSMVMLPLYMISGVMIPLSTVPQPYQDWLMWNPVAHGLEAARFAFAPHYHAVGSLSVGYLYLIGLVLLFFGLALHVQYKERVVEQ